MEALTNGAALACPPDSPIEKPILAPPLPCGLVLAGRYRLRERLASGATSHVYRADDLLTRALNGRESPLALKVYTCLRLGGRDLAPQLALAELHIARCVQHPHILRIHELGWDAPVCFLSMEYIAGESLARRLRRSPDGRLPTALIPPIARALAAAIDAAHEAGVVHGDIKPGNVLLGDGGEIKLIDFAGASLRGAEYGPRGFRAYSARYASPAVLAGRPARPRDDHYALGCLIHELLAGDPPYGKLDALEALRAGLRPRRPLGLGLGGWRTLRRVLRPGGKLRHPRAADWVRRLF